MEEEFCGKFFVWTKSGHRPRFAHDDRFSALAEARRLAEANPGRKFIVQQFLDKVIVPVETRDGDGCCPVAVSTPAQCRANAEKEPAMQRTIWYGSKNDETVFSEDKSTLNNRGIDNPQSFTVDGKVEGLNLINAQPTAQSGSQQHA